MTSGMSPWDRKDSKFHGSLRGADSPRQSDTFQGRFGRMFRALPAAQFSDDDLIALASVGDGMEAEAWAYLAVRSLAGLPITFPGTTGAPRPISGGVLVKAGRS